MDGRHGTRLAVEPPVFLSAQARRSLDEDRRRLVEHDTSTSNGNTGTSEDTARMLNVLERAWIDETHTMKPPELPLSERLQKLWAERGDFSRFRASDLMSELEKKGKSLDDPGSPDEALESFGANIDGLEDDDKSADGDAEEKKDDIGAAAATDVMSIDDMRQLRTQMFEKLGVAQTSLFFGHALVSLLINSTKAGATGSEGSASGSRFGSPAVGSGKAGQSGPASVTHRSVMTQQEQALGSAASLEAELGIEPHVFGASRIQSMQRDLEYPQGAEHEDDSKAAVDDDEDGEVENMDQDLRKRLQLDNRLLDDEIEDRTRDMVESYQGKVDGIRSAVDILRRGAATLQSDTASTKRDQLRWKGLLQAKQGGWGLTPGRPIRGTASKQRELLDDGVYRRRDEPSRDAWVGYAMPEASVAYRRRALAYFSHATTASDTPSDALLFASRPGKRLRVDIAMGDEVWTSSVGDKDSTEGNSIDTLLRAAQSELADTELFDLLVGEVRSLSSRDALQARIVDSDCVAINVTADVTLRFAMVESKTSEKDEETSEAKGSREESAIANMLAAVLRLGLLQRYRASAGLIQGNATSKARLLQPILGMIHYASFVAAVRNLLVGLQSQYPAMRYDMSSYAVANDPQQWLEALLLGTQSSLANEHKTGKETASSEGPASSDDALSRLGASASVFVGSVLVSQLSFSYPSHVNLTVFKGTSRQSLDQGVHQRAVQLADLDLNTTRQILAEAIAASTEGSYQA